jgi:2'-5' RNA ligase
MARDHQSGPDVKPLRLFVAVDIPGLVKDGLLEAISPFRDRIPGTRWTQPSSWHVTLKFLGWVWPRLEDHLREAVALAAASAGPAFEAQLTEVGVFPSAARARVVWAGLSEEPAGRFAEIVKVLDDSLIEDFEPEQRAFTPHLTLARLAPPRRLDEFAPGLVGTEVSSESFPVRELVLYRSHLSPRGARYEPLVRAALGGDA